MTHRFDATVRPQDDYFGYVNNDWLRNNPIPKTETSWGTFYVLRNKSWEAVDAIVTALGASAETALTRDQKLLKDFFAATLRFEQNTDNHFATVGSLLKEIDAATPETFAALLGKLHRQKISAFWALYVLSDDKDSRNQVLRYYQSGLSLPNRDYYLERSTRMVEHRTAYRTYFANMQQLLQPLEIGAWSAVWRIEKAIARMSWTEIALRDVQKNYTKLTRESLDKACPRFDWNAYFAALGWKNPTDDLVADQFSFITSIMDLFDTEPRDALKAYLKWHVVNSYASWLSKETADLSFGFYGQTLSGQKELKPLWKRAVLLADRLVIGEALGREYAARHFPETSKRAVEKLVEDIRRAYHARIEKLTWMGDSTKKRAHTKLDNMKVFVGYPTIWKDLSSLAFSANNIVENCIHALELDTDFNLVKVGKKPAAEEW